MSDTIPVHVVEHSVLSPEVLPTGTRGLFENLTTDDLHEFTVLEWSPNGSRVKLSISGSEDRWYKTHNSFNYVIDEIFELGQKPQPQVTVDPEMEKDALRWRAFLNSYPMTIEESHGFGFNPFACQLDPAFNGGARFIILSAGSGAKPEDFPDEKEKTEKTKKFLTFFADHLLDLLYTTPQEKTHL